VIASSLSPGIAVPAIWAMPRRHSCWKKWSHDDLHRAQLSQAWCYRLATLYTGRTEKRACGTRRR
jgi:hypothetical protein